MSFLENFGVIYSNRSEELLTALSEKIIQNRTSHNIFEPINIVVPNPNVAQWIKFALAEKMGISASLQFYYLESFLHKIVQAIQPKWQVISKEHLQIVLFEILSNISQEKETEELYNYINAGTNGKLEKLSRLFSLASLIAKAFDDYALSRKDLLNDWNNHIPRYIKEVRYTSIERWQMWLWHKIFGNSGFLQQNLTPPYEKSGLLTNLAFQALDNFNPSVFTSLNIAQGVHFFGFSYVATSYLELWAKLANFLPVSIYTINPCAEFWDDVETLSEERRRLNNTKTPFVIEDRDAEDTPFAVPPNKNNDSLLLRLWARPGREHLRLLNIFTNCDFNDRFINPATNPHPTLLEHVQLSLFLRTNEPINTTMVDDKSITYLRSMGGARREIEATAQEIWKIVQSDSKNIQFHDIAIILAQQGRDPYLSEIQSVFEEYGNIPHAIIDLEIDKQSGLSQLFINIINMVFEDANRATFLKILTHPHMLMRTGGDANFYASACEKAGIFFGANAQNIENTYFAGRYFHWDQGLTRLTLGMLIKKDILTDSEVSGWQYPLAPEEFIDNDSVSKFLILSRSLLADWNFMRTEQLSFSAWAEVFLGFLQTYCYPINCENLEDELFRNSCEQAIASLKNYSTIINSQVSAIVAVRFLLNKIKEIKLSEQSFLLKGVVVSSFLPMRPVPFKYIFVLGMGEGHFPSSDSLNSLDLRNAKRRMSDVHPREQDKYMFLETLLSVRKRLIISWPARNAISGDLLSPSGLVKELNQALLELGLSNQDLLKLEQEYKLQRHCDTPNESLCASESLWYESQVANYSQKFGNTISAWPLSKTLIQTLFSPLEQNNIAINATLLPKYKQTIPSEKVIVEFLKNPLFAEIKLGLNIKLSYFTETLNIDTEPTTQDKYQNLTQIKEAIVTTFALAQNNIVQQYEQTISNIFLKNQNRSHLPIGILGKYELNKNMSLGNLFIEQLQKLNLLPLSHIYSVVNGVNIDANIAIKKITLDSNLGQTKWLLDAPLFWINNQSLILICFDANDKFSLNMEIEAFVKAILIALAIENIFTEIVLIKFPYPEPSPELLMRTYTLPNLDDCKNWLTLLINQWIGQMHLHFLPLDFLSTKTPLQLFLNNQPEDDKKLSELLYAKWQESAEGDSTRDKYMSQINNYPPPQNAAELLRKKLALFFCSAVSKA